MDLGPAVSTEQLHAVRDMSSDELVDTDSLRVESKPTLPSLSCLWVSSAAGWL